MWPDAYYISTREFAGGTSGPFAGIGAYAGNRAQMLAGNPNPTVISFLAGPILCITSAMVSYPATSTAPPSRRR